MQNAARCLCSSRRRNKSLSSFGLKRELLLLVVKCDAGYKVQRSHTLVLTINLKKGIIDDDRIARAVRGYRQDAGRPDILRRRDVSKVP